MFDICIYFAFWLLFYYESFIHFWEDGRWGNNRQISFLSQKLVILIQTFAAQLSFPALLFILCGTFETLLERIIRVYLTC